MFKQHFCAALFCSTLTLSLGACAPEPENEPSAISQNDDTVQVMVLGMYHFANPGQDVYNVEVDSVLSDTRQAELETLASCLMEFQPTKIAVESDPPGDSVIDPDYADFTPALLQTEANETTQIGYRLAYLSGYDTVYAIDERPEEGEPDYFPFGSVMEHIETTGQSEGWKAFDEKFGGMIKAFGESQASQTIPELLYEVNTGFLSDPDFYFEIMEFDQGETQPGAELTAMYYMRNAKIVSKLRDAAEPGDRILVVYGAGHKYFFDNIIEASPSFESIDPAPYLQRAADGDCP